MLRSVAEQPKSANLCSVHIISFRSVQRSSFKLNHCTLAYETASNYTKITKREKGGSTIELKCHEFPLHPHFPFLDDSGFQRWKWRHWWQCWNVWSTTRRWRSLQHEGGTFPMTTPRERHLKKEGNCLLSLFHLLKINGVEISTPWDCRLLMQKNP